MYLHADDFEKVLIATSVCKPIAILEPVHIESTLVGASYQFEIAYLDENGFLKRVLSDEGNTRFIKKDELE